MKLWRQLIFALRRGGRDVQAVHIGRPYRTPSRRGVADGQPHVGPYGTQDPFDVLTYLLNALGVPDAASTPATGAARALLTSSLDAHRRSAAEVTDLLDQLS